MPLMINLFPRKNRKSHPEVSAKELIWKISENLQESTCPGASFLIELQA